METSQNFKMSDRRASLIEIGSQFAFRADKVNPVECVEVVSMRRAKGGKTEYRVRYLDGAHKGELMWEVQSEFDAATPIPKQIANSTVKREKRASGKTRSAATSALSDYERRRLLKIARNEAKLKELGLGTQSKASFTPRSAQQKPKLSAIALRAKKSVDAARRKRQRDERAALPKRTSRRLRGEQTEGFELPSDFKTLPQGAGRVRFQQLVAQNARPGGREMGQRLVESGDAGGSGSGGASVGYDAYGRQKVAVAEDGAPIFGSDFVGHLATAFEAERASAAAAATGDTSSVSASASASASSSSASSFESAAAAGKATLRYAAKLAKLDVRSDRAVAKLVKDRIFSMAILPSTSALLIAAGDVKGRIGLWRPASSRAAKDDDEEEEDEELAGSITALQAHSRCVGGVLFDANGVLYSGGYDNQVRELNVARADAGFQTLTQPPHAADDDVTIHGMAFGGDAATPGMRAGTSTVFYGRNDGQVAFVDVRSQSDGALWQLHEKKVNTVHLRPHASHYLLTGSLDRTVCVWDLRKMAPSPPAGKKKKLPKPLCTLAHALSVNAAAWSPDGSQLVTTCQDHGLRTFSGDVVCAWGKSAGAGPRHSGYVRHNNKTGRWLSKFACEWDPREPSAFVVGSMTQPRCVEAYMARGGGDAGAAKSGLRQVMRLETDYVRSVLSINLWHPCLPILVVANSSGRVYLWE